jgi:hypothetical protein
MARKVRQIRRKGKAISIVPVSSTAAPDLDTRIALIQALIPVALEKVREELRADVERLAGERYVREGRLPSHVRWTAQRGSIWVVPLWSCKRVHGPIAATRRLPEERAQNRAGDAVSC